MIRAPEAPSDAENRRYSAGGVTYYYDGECERVAKSNGKLYLFGTGSAPVVETDTSGNYTAEYIFFGGKRVAMRKSDGSAHTTSPTRSARRTWSPAPTPA